MCADYSVSLLTLTIPNTLLLNRELFKWLSLNMKKLMRRYPLNDRVVGAVARIETDFNSDSQDFHVHIHMILIYRQCIPQNEIAEAWRDLTQPNGYVQSDVPGRASNPCVVWIEKIEPGAIKKTVSYLFKSRPFKDAEAFAEYDCGVKNTRLVQAYGKLFERKRKAQGR